MLDGAGRWSFGPIGDRGAMEIEPLGATPEEEGWSLLRVWDLNFPDRKVEFRVDAGAARIIGRAFLEVGSKVCEMPHLESPFDRCGAECELPLHHAGEHRCACGAGWRTEPNRGADEIQESGP